MAIPICFHCSPILNLRISSSSSSSRSALSSPPLSVTSNKTGLQTAVARRLQISATGKNESKAQDKNHEAGQVFQCTFSLKVFASIIPAKKKVTSSKQGEIIEEEWKLFGKIPVGFSKKSVQMEDQEFDSMKETSKDASGTGTGEGVGSNDVGDQNTDED